MDGGGYEPQRGLVLTAELTESKRQPADKKQEGDGRGKMYTAYTIHCTSGPNQWTTEKRFSDFRQFRDTLIKSGAGPLSRVEFPRKTVSVSRSSSGKTDKKRLDKLQNWLNLVISSYATEPTLGPHIVNFLDEDATSESTMRMSTRTIQTNMSAFEPEPKQLVGNWRATGVNNFKAGGADPDAAFEEELFFLRMEDDGETLTGGDNNPQNSESSAYKIENVELFKDRNGFVILQFIQVYADGTKTGWYSVVDQAHINLTNGTWVAQSGVQEGRQVGTFIAQKLLEDPTPGRYRVISEDGVLVRAGLDKDSEAITKLDMDAEVEVTRVFRRDDGVMRLCFSQAGLEISQPNAPEGGPPRFTDATQELWVSERHSENSCLLLEEIVTDGDSYNVVVVGEGLLEQQVTLHVHGVESLTDLTDQITAAVPALVGATNLTFMYFEQDFEEFVLLSDGQLEELPTDLQIKVDGTPAPSEPAPSEPEPSEPEPSGESTVHLIYIETVDSNPLKLIVDNPTTVEDLEAKLRASESVASKTVGMPAGAVSIHPVSVNGSEKVIGPPFAPSAVIAGQKQKFCVKAAAETGIPPVEPLPERTPPQPISLKVCLLANDTSETDTRLVSNTRAIKDPVTVSSLDELVEPLMAYVDEELRAGIDATAIEIRKDGVKLTDIEQLRGEKSVKLTLHKPPPAPAGSRWRCCASVPPPRPPLPA